MYDLCSCVGFYILVVAFNNKIVVPGLIAVEELMVGIFIGVASLALIGVLERAAAEQLQMFLYQLLT